MFKKIILIGIIAFLVSASVVACSEPEPRQMPIPSASAEQSSPTSQMEEKNSTETITAPKAITVPEFINIALKNKYDRETIVVVTGIVTERSNIVSTGGSEIYIYLILGPETSGYTVMVNSRKFRADLTDQKAQEANDSIRSIETAHATDTVTIQGSGGFAKEYNGNPVILIQDAIVQ